MLPSLSPSLSPSIPDLAASLVYLPCPPVKFLSTSSSLLPASQSALLPPSSASLVCLPVQSLSTSSSCLPPQPVTSSNPYLRRLPSCLHSSPPCCLPGLPVCQLPTRHPTPSHCTLLDLSHPRPPSPYLLVIYSRIIHSFIHSKPYLDTAGCTRDG